MGHHVDHPHPHQRREADRAAGIVGEHQEGAAVGHEAAVQDEPVHDCRHAVLAHAVAHVVAREVGGGHVFHAARFGQVRAGKVGRATHGVGQRAVDDLQRHLAGLAGRHLGRIGRKTGLVGIDRGVERAGVRVRLIGLEGVLLGMAAKALFPLQPGFAATGRDLAPGVIDLLRHGEGVVRPVERHAGGGDFRIAQRRAVHVVAALLVGRAEADDGAAGDHRRLVGHRAGGFDRGGNGVLVMPVDRLHVPARRFEAHLLVHRGRYVGGAVDGDLVVVPHHDQVAKPVVAGEVDRLVAHAFHQAAIAGDHVGVVIHQIVPVAGVRHPLGERHADSGREALAERPGGHLDPLGVAVFRVAGGAVAHLTEVLDLLHAHVVVTEQVVDRVDQHRAVAGAHHEAVAVGPFVGRRVDLHEAVEQHGGDVGGAHRRAGVARVRGLNRIHRQRPDGIGHLVFGAGVDIALNGHIGSPQARLEVVIRRSIIGVKISCMAMSILPPGMTIELARLMKLSWIIDSR